MSLCSENIQQQEVNYAFVDSKFIYGVSCRGAVPHNQILNPYNPYSSSVNKQ